MNSTARDAGLYSCHACGRLNPARPGGDSRCERCGARVHARRPHSIERTWALLIAALLLYGPANLLPIMVTDSLFGSQADTIMSGVAFLWTSGSWPLAVVVFVASVFVPLAKMLSLAVLLISVRRATHDRPEQLTALYRAVEFVGRWSMLDVYVVTMLVALVQAGRFARIEPGPGVVAFGAVVVLTMFASMSFDPRLIWDAQGRRAQGPQPAWTGDAAAATTRSSR